MGVSVARFPAHVGETNPLGASEPQRPHGIKKQDLPITDISVHENASFKFAKVSIKNATRTSGDADVIVCIPIRKRERIGT